MTQKKVYFMVFLALLILCFFWLLFWSSPLKTNYELNQNPAKKDDSKAFAVFSEKTFPNSHELKYSLSMAIKNNEENFLVSEEALLQKNHDVVFLSKKTDPHHYFTLYKKGELCVVKYINGSWHKIRDELERYEAIIKDAMNPVAWIFDTFALDKSFLNRNVTKEKQSFEQEFEHVFNESKVNLKAQGELLVNEEGVCQKADIKIFCANDDCQPKFTLDFKLQVAEKKDIKLVFPQIKKVNFYKPVVNIKKNFQEILKNSF